MTEEQIIEGLRNKNRDVVNWIIEKYYPVIIAMLIKYGGDYNDARSIFNQGLQALVENIADNSFKRTSSIKTYLYAICRHIWFGEKEQKKRDNEFVVRYLDVERDNEKTYQFHSESDKIIFIEKLKNYISKLGPPCDEILLEISKGK